jgi:RNA polymerase sigma factor for flagellar operon FliA
MTPPIFSRRHRRRLVRQGLDIVERLAHQLAPPGRGHMRDELASVGRAALPRVLQAYDPARNVFAPYAHQRLRWAMIDGIRHEKRRQAPNALPLDALSQSDEGRVVGQMPSFDEALVDRNDPEMLLCRAQLLETLNAELHQLPTPQRHVLERYYVRGERLDRVAAELGVSKSTASRLHTRALARVRSSLEARGYGGGPRARPHLNLATCTPQRGRRKAGSG